MTCWRCGYGHRDDDGLCRQCGSDWFFEPRPPTREELLIINRYKVNPPTFAGTINTRVPAFLDD